MHPHTIIATVLGCGVIAVVAFVRPHVEEVIVGDVPLVPMELRPAREEGMGGIRRAGGRAVTDGSHSHVGTGQ